jgi:amidase
MATKDKMQTTAGSWALLGSIVPRDAYVVERLRLAGAIILGHTNMSEWSSVRSKQYSTGYSPRRGQVRNPYNLSRSPCKVFINLNLFLY